MELSGDPYAFAKVLEAGMQVTDSRPKLVRHFKDEFDKTLTGPRSGRVYTTLFFMRNGKLYSYGKRIPHQASAPGEAPAIDTGMLLRSIKVDADETEAGLFTITATSSSSYAAYLEVGTSKMRARPWMMPTMLRASVGAREILAAGIGGREQIRAMEIGGRG